MDNLTSNNSLDNSSVVMIDISRQYPKLYGFVEFLDNYYIPFMIILGVIGNIIAFVLFCFSPLKRLSLSVYLAALAVSDSLFLLSLGVGWLDNPGLRLFHMNGWCHLTIYTSYVCSFLSVWFIVGYTIERYIATCHPMQRIHMCTTHKARITVVSLCVVALSMYACTLKTSGVVPDKYTDRMVCSPYLTDKYYKIHLFLTYWDCFVTFILPFSLILCFNVRIFLEMTWLSKKRNEHVPIASNHHCPDHYHRHPNTMKTCPHGQGQVKVTRLLLIISNIFLCLSLPSYAIRIHAFIANMIGKESTQVVFSMLLQQLCQYLFYLNYCINTIVYLACWRKFRTILMNFLRGFRSCNYSSMNVYNLTSMRPSSRRSKSVSLEEAKSSYI